MSGSDISDYDHALGNALMQQPLVMLPRLDEALRAVVLAPRPTATPSCTAPRSSVGVPMSLYRQYGRACLCTCCSV